MKNLRELRDSRAAKAAELDALNDLAVAEKRDLTDEEDTTKGSLLKELRSLDTKIDLALEEENESLRRAQKAPAVHLGVEGNRNTSDADQRDLEKFSLGRVIVRKLNGEPLDGIDAEVLKEGVIESQKRGTSPKGNIVIPYELFAVNKEGRDVVQESVLAKRDLTVSGGSGGDQGGMTVATTIGRLYEALFNKIVLQQMGGTFLPNLKGNLDIPRLVKATDPAWKTETGAADESSPTFAKASLTPKRLPTFIEVTNQLLTQSEYNVDLVLRRYLLNALSSIFDRVGIQGTGASNQPTGILNTSGIGIVYAGGADVVGTNANGAAPVWADFPKLFKEIAIDNADFGSLGYLTNPNVVAKLQTTEKASSTAVFIMPEGAATINGFRTGVTNNVPSNLTKGSSSTLSATIFGNFQDLWMGTWGGIELLVNPYSRDTEGLTRINAAMFGDVAVVRPESFAAVKDFVA